MIDHDQRLKTVLKEFFADFVGLFFPEWAARFDFATVTWLDKEVFSDPPQGQRRTLDLVARLSLRQAVAEQRPDRGEDWIALIHVEVESGDSVAPLRPRMYEYYEMLRRTHRKPVLPIGLYLHVGLGGIGRDVFEERFWELPVLRFEYLYVGLPALEAEPHVAGDNVLGVALAALMHVPEARRAWLRAEALRRIVNAPENDWRKFLLADIVQTYVALDVEQQHEFDRLLATEPYKGVKMRGTTWFEQGEAAGLQQGLQQGKSLGRLEVLRRQLEARFGPLSPSQCERLDACSADRLAHLAVELLGATSLRELGLED